MTKKTDNSSLPTYWSKLPAEIRYDNNLPDGAKVLYSEIDSLSKRKSYCWASNSYFMRVFKKSKNTIGRYIKILIERGYISCRVDKSKANLRYLSTVPAKTFELMSDGGVTIPTDGDSTIPTDGDRVSPKMGQTIPTSGASYNRMNKKSKGEERKDHLPLSLDLEIIKNQIPESAGGKKLRASIDSSPFASTLFIAWLVTEAVGRFTKSIGLTVPQIKDYESQVWEKFEGDTELLTKALVAIVTGNKTKGHLPSIKAIREMARKVKKIEETRMLVDETKKRIKPEAEPLITIKEYSDTWLKLKLKNATGFERERILREMQRRGIKAAV